MLWELRGGTFFQLSVHHSKVQRLNTNTLLLTMLWVRGSGQAQQDGWLLFHVALAGAGGAERASVTSGTSWGWFDCPGACSDSGATFFSWCRFSHSIGPSFSSVWCFSLLDFFTQGLVPPE